MIIFDLQLFGSSTTVQGRDLTDDEKKLIKLQADAAEHFQPNILWLNDVAKNLLDRSQGAMQIDFTTLNDNAQNQISNATGRLAGLSALNGGAVAGANNVLGNISDQYGQAAINNYGRLQGLANQYDATTQAANGVLGGYAGGVNRATDAANSNLANYIGAADQNARNTNNKLNDYINSTDKQTDNTNADLSEYINQNNRAFGTVDNSLSGLQNGVLPSAYLQNMEDAIRGTLQKTMGENLNSMAQRGVINSSVNESAQNAIANNAAGAVASNYLNNLNTVGNFAQQRFLDNNATTSANAAMAQNQLQNIINKANTGAQLTQQQYANLRDAINTGANLTQQQLGNVTNAAGIGANLTQQQLGNTNSMLGNIGNIYGQQYGQLTDTLGLQGQLAQQQLTNTMNGNAQNAGLYGNLISNANAPITTAAAAQQAAQDPALRLWQASTGIQSTNNNTLSAIAGAQPQSQTVTTSGGGFLGGLLGTVAQGVGAYYGAR